jgi:release factor glutamine methyltransferase
MQQPMTIRELYRETVQRLQAGGIEEAEIEAALLLGRLLGLSRSQLVLAGEQPVSAATTRNWEELLTRRLGREPLAYILGEWEFWSLPFEVTPAVLIPRPETELLLETALEALKAGPGTVRLLDLGAGSGIIPVVLARELPQAAVYSLDCSCAALAVAARNARRNGVAGRVRFIASDWLQGIRRHPSFDAVISNPPYIDCGALADLQPEVRDFEPHLALDGGRNGLDVIAHLGREIAGVLKPGGRLFMEIGFDQGETAADIFKAAGDYRDIRVRRDYAGHPRILEARKKG